MTTGEHAALDDQLCFALYAAARAVTGAYKPMLTELGLTYPQYVTMLAVWEHDGSTVSELGTALDLDSGTLSPILQRLDRAGYIRKSRSGDDERNVHVFATDSGRALEGRVTPIRESVESCTGLSEKEFTHLRDALHQLRDQVHLASSTTTTESTR